MKLYTTISALQTELNKARMSGLNIGFTPTMGALHEGHLSLVSKAGNENDLVVVSIFVNPTQFNDQNDLERYPRTLESDMDKLSPLKCDYVFAPMINEVYPVPDTRKFDFGNLETVMEGQFRPGHFNGVAQVVSRLFDIVKPDKAYFGLKDFQQLAIIKELVRQLNYPVKIISCEIVREPDGLAMSSRNMLLQPEYRKVAPIIYRTLLLAKKLKRSKSVEEIKELVKIEIETNKLLKVEYFEIVDETRLFPVVSWNQPTMKIGCIAVIAGNIRLIDNIKFDNN